MAHIKSVLNVGAVWNGTYPFINWLKTQGPRGYNNLATFPPSMDANGYPKSGTLGTVISGGGIYSPSNYTGPWVLKWTGKCGDGVTAAFRIYGPLAPFTVTVGSSFVIGGTSSQLNVSGTNGTIEFSTAAVSGALNNNWQIDFLAGGSFDGTLSNMRLYRKSDETAVNAGEIFLPEFITALQSLNPKVLRFLDWTGVNENIQTKWAYRTPLTHYQWADRIWPASIWGGTTSGTGAAYTCSAATDTPGSYTDMETIQVFFHTANTTTTPTLNVGGRGAKIIKDRDWNTTIGVGSVTSSLRTLVYDAAIGAWGMYGETIGVASFVPIEVQVALCNKLSCDLWSLLPCFMFDSTSVTAHVQYIRDNLNSGLKLYLETGNETWNFGFSSNHWMTQRAASSTYNFAGGYFAYQGYLTRVVMGIATTAWAPRTSSELRRVCAFQADANKDMNFGTPAEVWKGKSLTASGYDTAPNRPIDYTDILSYATYINGGQVMTSYNGITSTQIADFLAAADSYATGVPASMTTALAFMETQVRTGGPNPTGYSQPMSYFVSNIYAGWVTPRTTVGSSAPFYCYEGAFQMAGLTSSECTAMGISTAYATKTQNLVDAYKNSTAFKTAVLDQYQQMVDGAGTDAAPCWYYMGRGGYPDPWSLYPNNFIDSTPYKSFNAIAEWNATADPGPGPSVPATAAPLMLAMRLRLHA